MIPLTIKDIAKLSGYSVSTVSRVLNNSPEVSEETRVHILEIVEEYNFIPNKTARQLKQQVSNHIAMIVKGTQNLLFARVLEILQHQFREENYTTTVYYIDENDNEVQQALQLQREQKPKAILFMGGNLSFFRKDFSKITVPSILVTTSASGLGFSNLSSAYTDDVAGGASAVEHLFSLGHETIGLIGGDLTQSVISQLRYTGCQQAFMQQGRETESNFHYVSSRFSFAGGYQAMLELLEKTPKVTAVFAMSDVMAIGAIRALADKGLRVPEDISIVGYDGIELSKYYTPSLSTIRQDYQQLATRSVAMLLGQLNGTLKQAVHETIPFTLLKRESTKELSEKVR